MSYYTEQKTEAAFYPKRNRKKALEVMDQMVEFVRTSGYSVVFEDEMIKWDSDSQGYHLKVTGHKLVRT